MTNCENEKRRRKVTTHIPILQENTKTMTQQATTSASNVSGFRSEIQACGAHCDLKRFYASWTTVPS
jgi:hypothetical protein